MPLAPTTRLGSYEIVAPLGADGRGVPRAPDRLARFEREARTVAGLNHPNIVVLHSIEEHDGTRFLTMELVEGQTLDARVTPGGLIEAEQVPNCR